MKNGRCSRVPIRLGEEFDIGDLCRLRGRAGQWKWQVTTCEVAVKRGRKKPTKKLDNYYADREI